MATDEVARQTPYLYQPLGSPYSIRLLRIEPGIDGPLSCSLETTWLSDLHHPYKVISYVWGEPVFVDISGPDGRPQAAQNPADALYRVRLPDRSRYVWADAVCIYPDRSRIKHRKNLRLGPLFYEAFDPVSRSGEFKKGELAD
jgi:Heterokaryon incompatibility protein (HET)